VSDEPTPPAHQAPGGEPVRVALSLHEGAPDGDHLDLFLGPAASAGPDDLTARCWRLPCAAWGTEGLAQGRFAATEIARHREEYLELAAPKVLAGSRGRAVPLARGIGWMAGGQVRALGRLFAFNPDGTVEISGTSPSKDR